MLIAASPTMDLSAAARSKPTRVKVVNRTVELPPSQDTNDPVSRTAISLEYASLRHEGHCPLGIYVTPSVDSMFIWEAAIFVHQGYYADSILKFTITFPQNYPERPPAVHFRTDVFHPLVKPDDGLFNLAPRIRSWRPREHHVFDVLHWIKASFKKHALDQIGEADAYNKEAYRYHETTASFAQLAQQTSQLSQTISALFDRDHPSMTGKSRDGIQFRQLKPDTLEAMRSQLGLHDWKVEPNFSSHDTPTQ